MFIPWERISNWSAQGYQFISGCQQGEEHDDYHLAYTCIILWEMKWLEEELE